MFVRINSYVNNVKIYLYKRNKLCYIDMSCTFVLLYLAHYPIYIYIY